MKSFVKYALAGVALVAASGAYADVVPGSGGNGGLILVVRDLNNPSRVFETGLNFTVDSFLSQGQIDGGGGSNNGVPITGVGSQPNVSYSSADLTSFMQSGSYEWAVLGSDSVGTSATTGAIRVLTTSETQFGAGLLSSTLYASIGGNGGIAAGISNFVTEQNDLLDAPVGSFTTAGTYGVSGLSLSAPTLFNNAGNIKDPAASAGTSQRLYVLTSGGSSTQRARIYQFADLTLSTTGVLSTAVGQTPEVPLPAAVWLLGSALVGLSTVRRRRNAEAAA